MTIARVRINGQPFDAELRSYADGPIFRIFESLKDIKFPQWHAGPFEYETTARPAPLLALGGDLGHPYGVLERR